ncbi:hypothetical protein N0V84_000409 [Fusarium piperis]|uniref:J domain-containing protein n=1 Tax=Fusarium piperis TaxID=1435070 RepID=A0A9W9BTY2_9HYPO|nr:hypothetical protein N0V84_000409 [Fusarium piperis]
MSTLPPDPYKALGVSPDAQLPEIRSAHRKLILKCHPDKVQDPTLKAQKQDEFQQVQQAYELLSDEKERQKYDDQVRLHEIREQLRAKAAVNSSSTRSTPTYKYEIRTNDRTYKTTSPSAKVYSYSRSYEDTDLRGADIFEGVRTVRREASYQGKPSRREERERDRTRETREARERQKERDLDREQRKKAEDAVRRSKEARRAEKKQKEKEKEKERKRESEDKKRHAKPYIETYDDEEPTPKSEKKKSSKKHDRDRSTHREEVPPATDSVPPPPMPSIPTEQSYEDKASEAMNYIKASRQKNPYARHMQPPAAPTPPPVGSPFAAPATPDDDVRRSSAKPRRGSSGEKGYKKKPSKEVLDDPIEVDVSPSGRPHVQKSATSTGISSGSPPRRTSTMPSDGYGGRPIPNLSRAQTYSGYPDVDSRGRNRSRMHAQTIESESEDEYEREQRRKERKHRSKKHRSPEPRGEHVMQYRVDGGRTTLHNSFSRSAEPQVDAYSGYYSHHGDRPSMSHNDSYSAGYVQYGKYKTSKSYDIDDVQYSSYPTYREEYAYPAAA